VTARARERLRGSPLAARMEFVEGSFFERVPAGGDAYVLKHIVHDWDDAAAIRILRNCRTAMPAGARLLLIECVLEPGNAPAFGKLLDLEMLAVSEGGSERTEAEFAALLAAADLRLARVVPTLAPTAVVEAVPA
jgi:O-methyltransferase domain